MEFNLGRVNKVKEQLQESPLVIPTTTYDDLTIKNGRLVDSRGNIVGTKGDMYQKYVLDKILQEGCLDRNPRPNYIDRYEGATYKQSSNTVITKEGEEIKLSPNDKVVERDGLIEVLVPAHTLSVNEGVECTYDLSKGESPFTTLRPIAIRSSVAEILWIYQQQSNDLVDFDELLNKRTWEEDKKVNNWWEEWAMRDANNNYSLNFKGHPHIGACYGFTTAQVNMIRSEVIEPLKKNPDGRRNITCLWQYKDFMQPHGLKPCAFLTIWNIRHGWDNVDYLDMTMVQRSSDFVTAGCINQVQYAALQLMVARELGVTPGYFTWKPVNVQIYDRHVEQAIELIGREPVEGACSIELNENVEHFDDVKPDDITLKDCPKQLIKTKNPQVKLPLGV